MQNPSIKFVGNLVDKLAIEHNYFPHYRLEGHAHVPSDSALFLEFS